MVIPCALSVGYKLVNDYTVCSKRGLQAIESVIIPFAQSVGYKLVNDYSVCFKCGLQAS